VHRTLDDLAKAGVNVFRRRDYTTLAREWRTDVRSARLEGASCRHYAEVRYEDLIRNTTATLMRICDFIDLAYGVRMERYFEFSPVRLAEPR
jgi:hypothetical protein